MPNLSKFSLLVACASGLASAAAHAQNTQADACYQTWKSADINRNGIIDVGETIAGGSLNTTRDMFLAQCLGPRAQAPSGSPASANDAVRDDFPTDLGKGDLTPGRSPFTHAEARKRLEALGYKNIEELALDAQGIWRGWASSAGMRAAVGLDPQGDVVSN